MIRLRRSLPLLVLLLSAQTHADDAKKLRILTWDHYAPADIIEDFRKETGIQIEVTLSSNEDIIARLKASGGAGFDLAQPSQDRITGAQQSYHIYKPIDPSRVNVDQYLPDMLEIAKKMTTLDGKLYALPYLWGAEGMVVNTRRTDINDYTDLCKPELNGKTTLRLRRPALMAFAFALGHDPFALYGNPKAYAELIDEVGRKLLSCKQNMAFIYTSSDEVLEGLRSDKIVAGMLWDSPAWEINRENPFVRFINPKSGALAWQDTFVLPAKGQNDAAAYAWINYTMRPDIAARITKAAGNFTSTKGTLGLVDPRLKTQFFESFPQGLKNIHWYPPVPAGLEDIEAKVLDKLKAPH